MDGSPRVPLAVEVLVGAAVGFGLAAALGRRGEATAPWIALGAGLSALLAFLLDRRAVD